MGYKQFRKIFLKRLEDRIRARLYKLFKNKGITKTNKTFDYLKYTPIDLYNHLIKWLNKPCKNCPIILNENNSHIDHIKPLSLAKSEKDLIILNELNNLRLLCGKCNLEKNKKYEYTK